MRYSFIMDNPVIIFGAKGLAKAALEILISNDIICYGFLEDDISLHNTEINGIPVLGFTDDHEFLKLIGQKCGAFIATDDNSLRKKWVECLNDQRKGMPMNAIHQSAIISESCTLGYGNFVNAGAVLSNNVKIGQHNIINSRAVIEQGCQVEDFVQIGAGTIINANVKVAKGVFIGSGVTVVSGVTIRENARIGAGSVVVGNVEKEQTVFGNPATEVGK